MRRLTRLAIGFALGLAVPPMAAAADTTQTNPATVEPAAPSPAADGSPDLSCLHPGNCVNSISASSLPPLRHQGPAPQAQAALLATLAEFGEAQVIRTEPLLIESIFTTTLGFRDQVIFRIDPSGQRIDFRSRSLLGLYDLGKNRSRMKAFAARFEQMRTR